MHIISYVHSHKTTLSLLLSMIMLFIIYSCEKSPTTSSEQNKKDNLLIKEFIQTHSLSKDGEITLTSNAQEGAIPLSDTAKSVGEIYIITLQNGTGVSPATTDKVNISYRAYYLNDLHLFDSTNSLYKVWISGVIQGLQRGLTSMKTSAVNEDGTYPTPGIAWIIIPSRLGWGAEGKQDPLVPANTCLLYRMELVSIDNFSE